MEGRLAALNPNNSISLALFASAVAHSLAAVVDDNARQLLVGDGSGECTMPFALRFEELAKQLMQVFSQRTIADFSLDNSTRECCGEIHFLRIFFAIDARIGVVLWSHANTRRCVRLCCCRSASKLIRWLLWISSSFNGPPTVGRFLCTQRTDRSSVI
jgi:hypothetical protein